MACNFGWDWGPTLVTAGIWQPIGLHAWSGARLAEVRPLSLFVLGQPRTRLVETEANERAFELDEADAVLAVGAGLGDRSAVEELRPLAEKLGGAIGGDRRAVAAGLVPPGRQIGLLGRAVAPRLYVAIETEGDFEHAVGSVKASVILVLKRSPAPVSGTADVALVGDWRETLPPLVDAFAGAL